jgi:hypothetical protein
MFKLTDLTKKQLIAAFTINLAMVQDNCFTEEGRKSAIEHMAKIQDAYTSKRGFGAIENEMMKQELKKLQG